MKMNYGSVLNCLDGFQLRPLSQLKWMEDTKEVMRDEDLNDKQNVNNTIGIVNIFGPPKLKIRITIVEIGFS